MLLSSYLNRNSWAKFAQVAKTCAPKCSDLGLFFGRLCERYKQKKKIRANTCW